MAERNFEDLSKTLASQQRHVCAGVDIYFNALAERCKNGQLTPEEFPEGFDRNLTEGMVVTAFATHYIEAVAAAGVAAAIKPNIQIYRGLGIECFSVMRRIREVHNNVMSDSLYTIDAKVLDLDSTNPGTDKELFELLGADAITVHILLGIDALRSTFLKRQDKGVFVLARTSNRLNPDQPFRGARQFQDLWVTRDPKVSPTQQLFEAIAEQVANENNPNLGVVLGATYPAEAGKCRTIIGPMTSALIPAVGEQGGKAEEIVPVALRKGELGIINSSRGFMFAPKLEGEDQWQATTRAVRELHDIIVTAQNQ